MTQLGVARVASRCCVAAVFIACGEAQPIRIGVVSGPDAVAAVRFAVDEVNASGGIGGRPLAISVMPDGGAVQANLALIAADSLTRDRSVIGVVGHSNSSASLTASQVYNEKGLVQVAPTSSAPLLSSAGPYTFRLVAGDVHQARFLAEQILGNGARPRVAVFYVNDDYGHALRAEFVARLADAAVVPIYEIRYGEGAPLSDVSVIVRALRDARPQVIAWLGRSAQLGDLLPSLRRVLPGVRVIGGDGLDARPVTENAGGTFTGVEYVCFVDLNGSRQQLQELTRRYRAKTGTSLTVEAALSYDAAMLIADAARAVGPDRVAIRDHLASLGRGSEAYQGATGRIAFDDNGDPVPSYCLKKAGPPAAAVAATGIPR